MAKSTVNITKVVCTVLLVLLTGTYGWSLLTVSNAASREEVKNCAKEVRIQCDKDLIVLKNDVQRQLDGIKKGVDESNRNINKILMLLPNNLKTNLVISDGTGDKE